MNVLALCAGVGGLELGVKLANPAAKCVCYVEGEAYAAAVLVKRMEEKMLDEAPIWSDVRTFDGRPWRGKVDCITGGYPCQPFSSSGKRLADKDHRHLWQHIRRIVEEVQPQRCLFENVSNHLRMGYEQVHDDLQRMGYRVAAGLFTAAEVGASHQRERLFILGYSDCRGCSLHMQLNGNKTQDTTNGCPCGGYTDGYVEEMANIRTGDREDSLFAYGPEEYSQWLKIIKTRPDFTPSLESKVHGMDDGFARRVDRNRACGNSVVCLVGAYAWRVLEDSLKV